MYLNCVPAPWNATWLATAGPIQAIASTVKWFMGVETRAFKAITAVQ